jgi:hypothetical protein
MISNSEFRSFNRQKQIHHSSKSILKHSKAVLFQVDKRDLETIGRL